MPSLPAPPTPELLYLLAGDEEDLLAACENLRPADVAEALNKLPVEAAARVVSALPFDLAVQLLDEPELDRRGDIFELLDERRAIPLVEALASDQQVELFRDLKEGDRTRLLHVVDATTRDALKVLLAYPPTSAAGIMTTEFVAVPAAWKVGQVRQYIGEVGQAKETVYAIYVLHPDNQRLETVVSLREIMQANPDQRVGAIADGRRPVTVAPMTDREDVARLISKYNLLALPVVDDQGHVLGIVTVDDVIDALIREQTEDVQKFGGMAAVDEPYMQIGFGAHGAQAGRLALRALFRRDADGGRDGTLPRTRSAGPSCWRCSFHSSSARAAIRARRPPR